MPEITCIGSIGVDIVGSPIDSLPPKGTLGSVERIELHTGGCAANTGMGLAILGVDTAIIGKVGADTFGEYILNRFRSQGVDTSAMVIGEAGATSATMVFVHSDGERSFRHFSGGNGTLALEEIDRAKVLNSKILHIAGMMLMPSFDGVPCAQLLKEAQTAGVITTLDTAWDTSGRWGEIVVPCLPYTDYFLPSFEEAKMLAKGQDTPEGMTRYFQDCGAKVVGIKMGAQGCYFRAATGDTFTTPAIKVDVVDTLGAGDAFMAGFLTALHRGWSLEQCATFAVTVGGCCVQALGATTGLRGFVETLDLMERANRG